MPEHIDLHNFLPFRLNRAAAVLSRRLSELYSKQYGLDIPQWRVVATLGHRQTCTAQAIVNSTYTHKSTISRAVSKLVAAGLIESFSSDTDKREIQLRFTASGRALYDELVPLVRDVEAKVIAQMQSDEYSELLHALSSLECALGITPDIDANDHHES